MNSFLHLVLLTMLIFVADIATEIYVPALPSISYYFNVPTYLTKLTVSYNIIGLAVSGLFYGVLSDYYGRKPVIIYGTIIFVISSVLCIVATNIYWLIFFRLLQGVGQGVAIVVGFASIRDVYHGRKCAQIISKLSMVVAVSPAFAPIIGSFILHYLDWKFIFVFLALLGICAVVFFMIFFQETLKEKSVRKKFSVLKFCYSYIKLLENRRYIAYALISILNFIWLWNVIATLPFLFIDDMGITVRVYGYLMALGISGYFIGTILNQIFVMKFGIRKMLNIGLFLPLITDSILIVLHHSIVLTPLMIQSIWFFNSVGLSFIFGNATTLALDQVDDCNSSKAMALLVFFEMMMSALSIYINSFFYTKNILSVSVLTVICSIVAIIVFYIQTLNNLLSKIKVR